MEVFGDLKEMSISYSPINGFLRGQHTSHIWSLYSIREFTASIAKKLLSSMPAFSAFSLRMLGVMTVARLCISILLPVSSSTCENDEAQTRKEKSISNESRWLLGSRQHVRCKTLRRFSSSVISGTHQYPANSNTDMIIDVL